VNARLALDAEARVGDEAHVAELAEREGVIGFRRAEVNRERERARKEAREIITREDDLSPHGKGAGGQGGRASFCVLEAGCGLVGIVVAFAAVGSARHRASGPVRARRAPGVMLPRGGRRAPGGRRARGER
jgi:hypothetical protein